MARYTDKIVVVIGGNSGIGLASAEAFAAEGAIVVLTGRDRETVAAMAARIGPAATGIAADIADTNARASLFADIKQRFGRIDTLFVNAGVGAFVPIERVTEADWNRIVDINLKGAYFTIQAALPLMTSGGAIVLNASVGHRKGLPGNSVYGASKAGLRSLARTLGAELVDRGIRINCVSPGPIDTPIIGRTQGLEAQDVPAAREMMRNATPMKRLGRPEEVARAVLFLGSDEASFITGEDIFVDGGLTNF